jgi:acetyl-CoA C-acetyltransferase
MWAGFSEAAARHPNAWTRRPLTAEEITTPSAENRPIAFPCTKRMVSLVMADLGAAVIVTTARRAAEVRGGAGQPVYFLGGGFAKDRRGGFRAPRAELPMPLPAAPTTRYRQ